MNISQKVSGKKRLFFIHFAIKEMLLMSHFLRQVIIRDSFIFFLLFMSLYKNFSVLTEFFLICIAVFLPETIIRIIARIDKNIIVLLVHREQVLDQILHKDDKSILECNGDIKKLPEYSLSMLTILTAITLGLVICAISYFNTNNTGLDQTKIILFVFVTALAFICSGVNLSMCYSILAPCIPVKVLVASMQKYYKLMLYTLSFIGIALLWGIYTFSNLVKIEFSVPGILYPLSGFGLLLTLYYYAYVYRVEKF